jgi:carboxymethylenebutenolidase
MTAHEIKIDTPDGPFMAYLVVPEGATKRPAVVIIQEIFGVNENIRTIARTYAAQGYIAIAPDLFWRQEPGIQLTDQSEAEWARAFELFKGFDVPKGVEDIQATINAVRAHPHCTGKVGAVGFCLGGLLAYLTAARTDIDAAVGYYGVGLDQKIDERATITKPLILHVAEKDEYCPPPVQKLLTETFAGSPNVTVHLYPNCDHAFARLGGAHFDQAAADLANGRSQDLFKSALG